jgi:peptide deformylase
LIQAHGSEIYHIVAEKVGSNADLSGLINQLKQTQQQLRHPLVSVKHLNLNVAVFSIDLSVIKQSETNLSGIFVNPEITTTKAPLVSGLEDDLSLPRLTVSIARPKQIEVSFLDEQLKEQKAMFSDLAARWIQHGIEQLNGVSIIDQLNAHRKRSVKAHLKRLEEHKIVTNYKLQYDN